VEARKEALAESMQTEEEMKTSRQLDLAKNILFKGRRGGQGGARLVDTCGTVRTRGFQLIPTIDRYLKL